MLDDEFTSLRHKCWRWRVGLHHTTIKITSEFRICRWRCWGCICHEWQLYAAKSDGIDARAAARPSNHIYTAALYQSTVHRSATAAGWLIRLPVLHDTRRLVSKQTVGLRDVCTLKNGPEEEGDIVQRDKPLEMSRALVWINYTTLTFLFFWLCPTKSNKRGETHDFIYRTTRV